MSEKRAREKGTDTNNRIFCGIEWKENRRRGRRRKPQQGTREERERDRVSEGERKRVREEKEHRTNAKLLV